MGPDGINPRLLRTWSGELAEVFQHLFSLSRRLRMVPRCGKPPVPVPKVKHPQTLNNYRPVAPTFSCNYGTCHLQKFSDDSSIAGRISADEEEDDRNVVESLACWSELNHLKLNISETKELVLDFRKGGRTLTPILQIPWCSY